mgnify:CR=1 FL=1|tara:strand:- start:288 stop:1061 length:774 start_codon:yes stop_codon:yes gene_type:complete
MKIIFLLANRLTLSILCGFVLLFGASAHAHDVNIKKVVTTSPSWDTFTNRDGTGLYHEIMQKVFSLHGITVEHLYSKSGRSEKLVADNQADIMMCDDKPYPSLVMGRYPMYQNDFYVFYKKERIGPWRGVETLRDREVLSQATYYDHENFNVPVTVKDVQTGEQALKMIVWDRSDFYVDDMTLIRQSMKSSTISFQPEEYAINKVGSRSYFPLFNTSARGKRLQEVYAKGIYTLHKRGELKPIYDKWGYKYPDFEAF